MQENQNIVNSARGNNGPSLQSRNWVFTSFREDEPKFDDDNLEFLAYGKETCPSTGRQHWQCFCVTKKRVTRKGLMKITGDCWCDVIRGTLAQNEKYCSKDGNYKTFGKLPIKGSRTDIDVIKNEIVQGTKVDDICMERPKMYHQYGRTLNKIEDICMRKKFRKEMTEGIWLWGKTGVGKSHIQFEEYDPDKVYLYTNDGGWWDGYTQQETVIINDFRGEIKYSDLLKLVDKWPYNVRRRGREPMPFTSKKVIISSSMKPSDVFCNLSMEDSLDQLTRRFKIIELTDKNIQKPM